MYRYFFYYFFYSIFVKKNIRYFLYGVKEINFYFSFMYILIVNLLGIGFVFWLYFFFRFGV